MAKHKGCKRGAKKHTQRRHGGKKEAQKFASSDKAILGSIV